MKLNLISTITALLLCTSLFSQDLNQREVDEKSGEEIFVGLCNREILEMDEFGEIYRRGFESYEINIEKLMDFSEDFQEVRVIIIFAVWCEDSHLQVPRFMKIVEEMGVNPDNISFILVNRDKVAPNVDMNDIVIEKVPTFIFKNDEEEIGRITECPKKSLEEDIYNIFLDYKKSKDKSKENNDADDKKDNTGDKKKKEDPNAVKLAPSNVIRKK